MTRCKFDNRLGASVRCMVWAFLCTILFSFSSIQNIYSSNTKVMPEVLISNGYTYSSSGRYDVEFTIGDLFVVNGEYTSPSNSNNTLGLGFLIGDVLSARSIRYVIDDTEYVIDSIIPGCDIIPFEAPVKKDSVFVGWFPSLPELMPDKDIVVYPYYRSINWEVVPSKKAFCPGEVAEFTILSDELRGLSEYRVEYLKEQLDGGFIQYGFEKLDVYDDSVKFEVPIPIEYIGENESEEFRVRLKYDDGHESSVILFRCNINLPSSLLLTKYGEIVIFNKNVLDVKEVAWFKNDVYMNVFGTQYTEDSKLYGEYSAVVRTNDEVERKVCAKSIYYEVGLEQGLVVNPNPAKSGEEIKITVKGFSNNQIKDAQLDVFDVLGAQRMVEISSVEEENYLTLSKGVYIVSLRLATGKVYSLKFIVY